MKSLQQIYDEVIVEFPNRHTDKGMGAYGPVPGGPGHTYAGFYDLLFGQYRHNQIDFLEIGVNRGGSLVMWRRFFENLSTSINGVDIRNSFEPFKKEDNISAYVFDAADSVQFNSVFGDKKFDIILDDGAHEKESQVNLFNLYSSRIKPGGLYVIEDIQYVSDNIEYFIQNIQKKPTIIDRRFINEQLDDVMLVYRF
jgi:hypothetical protein